jgi:HlyD family secretion protein
MELSVKRGDSVRSGEPLFVLDREEELAEREELAHRLSRYKAELENLKKGKRPTEITAIESQLKEAEAALKLSETEMKRREWLFGREVISKEQLDVARSVYDQNAAKLNEIRARLETARLGARMDEIVAAEAEVRSLEAMLKRADWKLAQKVLHAPTDGWVENTFYEVGEWVPPGRPVVSLLPPENIKIVFFVPEPRLSGIRMNQEVTVSWDGAEKPVRAGVRFISSRAEFTPPVIYSKEARSKLVYLVEAWPTAEDAARFHPGQPVDIRLDGKP